MDPHERFMRHCTTEVTDILANTPTDSFITRLVGRFNDVVENSYKCYDSLSILKTLHTMLCSFYQERFDPSLHENSLPKFNAQISAYPFNDINVKTIQNLLYTHDQSMFAVEVSLVLDILVLHMLLFCDETKIWINLKELQDSIYLHLDVNNDVKLLDVKLMDCYVNSLLLHQRKSETTNKLKSEKVSASFLENVKKWFTLEDHKDCQILTLLLPKLIKLNGENKILTEIWEMIFNLIKDPGFKLSTLHLTADLWFPIQTDYDKALFDLAMEEQFWLLLLKGLSSRVPQQRKQALYLVEKVIGFADKHKIDDFELSNYREIRPLICVGNESQQNAFRGNLNNFLSILKALEEKEKHLLTPVRPLLKNLIKEEIRETGLHPAWICCAFTRILHHDNNYIVKWGLLTVFTLDPELYNEDFLIMALDALKHTYLFENRVNGEEPTVVKELTRFLNDAETRNTDLVTRLMVNASKVTWDPLALHYVIHALSMVKRVSSVWKDVELEAVKLLAEISSTMHCQILRLGSQIELLETMTHFATESINLSAVVNTLSAFSTSEALIRGQMSWKQISAWLSKIVNTDEALNFLENICGQLANKNCQLILSMKSFSLIIMLFYDGNVIFNSKLCPGLTILRNLLHCLIGADSRPYTNAELRKKSIELVGHLLGFIISKDYIFCEFISDYIDVTLRLIFKNLRKTFAEAFVNNIDTYVSITQQIFAAESSIIAKREVLNHIERFEIESWNIIDDEEFSNNVQRLFGIKILYVCLKAKNAKLKNYTFIGPLYNTYRSMKRQLPENTVDVNSTCDASTNLTDKVAAEYYKFVADLFYEYLKDESPDEWLSNIDWIDQVLYFIQVGNNDIFIPLVGILSQLFYKEAITETNIDKFKSALRICWKFMLESLECKRRELALDEMMNLIFSSPFLERKDTLELTMECINEMLDKTDKIPRLSIILVKGLKQAKAEYLPNFYNAVLACLLYGTDSSLDRTIELQARSYVFHCYQDVYPNYLSNVNINDDAATRAHAITLLHKMITDDPTHAVKLLPLIIAKLDESQSNQNIGDSQRNNFGNRIMQVLLVLQPVLEKDDIESVHSLMCNNIFSESSQPSVKIMQEWLLVRIYLESETLRAKIWDLFDQGQEKRMNSLCSVISVVHHVARLLTSDLQLQFLDLAFQYIMPWCMTLQIDVRLYAQVVACKLYELATKMSYSTVTAKYREIHIAITKSLKCENLEGAAIELQNYFYLTVFHPLHDYSLQTLFYELPRLSSVSCDEHIPSQMFEKFGFKESNSHPLKLLNLETDMNEVQISTLTLKASGSATSDDADSNED